MQHVPPRSINVVKVSVYVTVGLPYFNRLTLLKSIANKSIDPVGPSLV